MSITNNKDPSGDASFQDSNSNNNNKDQPLEGGTSSQPLTLEAQPTVSEERPEEPPLDEPKQPQALLVHPKIPVKPAVPRGLFLNFPKRTGLELTFPGSPQYTVPNPDIQLSLQDLPEPEARKKIDVIYEKRARKALVQEYDQTRSFILRICNGEFAIEVLADQQIVWQYIPVIGYWVQIEFFDLQTVFQNKLRAIMRANLPVPFDFKSLSLLEFVNKKAPSLLKDALRFNRSKIPSVKGLNFQNCYLNLDKHPFELIKDKNSKKGLNVKNLMLMHYLPYDYDSKVLPSTSLLKTLLEVLNNDLYSLFKLRCLFKICIEGPFMELQTGFLLWGAPASGKSTIVNFLMELVGKLETANLRPKEFDNEFTLQSCLDKKFVVLSEPGFLNYEAINNFKMLLGRDPVSPKVKFLNTRTTRRFKGFIVITSNSPPDSIASDAGLISRLVEIETKKITNQKSINLLTLLKNETIGLINWALAMPPEDLPKRADETTNVSKYSNNVYVSFMAEYLTFDPGGLILIKTLLNKMNALDLWRKKKQKPSDSNIVRQIVDLANVIFYKPVEKTERKYFLHFEKAIEFLKNPSAYKNIKVDKTWLPDYEHNSFLVPPIKSPEGNNEYGQRQYALKGIRARLPHELSCIDQIDQTRVDTANPFSARKNSDLRDELGKLDFEITEILNNKNKSLDLPES